MRVSTKSWHYFFYKAFNESAGYEQLNLCNYLWKVFRGMFWVSLATAFLFFLLVFLLEPYVVLVMTTITGHFIPMFFFTIPDFFAASALFQFLVGGAIVLEQIKKRLPRIHLKPATPKPESSFFKIVRESYRSFKDKTCVKIEAYTPEEKKGD